MRFSGNPCFLTGCEPSLTEAPPHSGRRLSLSGGMALHPSPQESLCRAGRCSWDGLHIMGFTIILIERLCEGAAPAGKSRHGGAANAQFFCGYLYGEGQGTAKDPAKALKWYEKAALQGHAAAQYCYGSLYLAGEGVERDSEKAFSWREKAALQGFAKAQYSCAVMCREGEGTAKNAEKAFTWCEKTALQGFAEAQYFCGQMYGCGQGTAVDKQKAFCLFEKAALQGHADRKSVV